MTLLRTAWPDSHLSGAWTRLQRAAERATLVTAARNVAGQFSTAFRGSRVNRSIRRLDSLARSSFLYGWLTAEPEPEVVVIDLRETRTVGPVLALLDWTVAPLVRHWERARVGRGWTALSDRFVTRPVRVTSTVVLAAVLANLLVLAALGSPTPRAVGARLVVLALALAGTRVTVSAADLSDAHTVRLLVALLSPPEPPERDERDDRPRE